MSKQDTVTGVIQRIIDGKHGPYAVAKVDALGNVTFSLASDVWHEDGQPSQGEVVLLRDIRKKRAGWRALDARYLRPSDIQQQGT